MTHPMTPNKPTLDEGRTIEQLREALTIALEALLRSDDEVRYSAEWMTAESVMRHVLATTPPTPTPDDDRPECAECDETAVGIAWCDAGVRPVCGPHMDAYIAEGVRTTPYIPIPAPPTPTEAESEQDHGQGVPQRDFSDLQVRAVGRSKPVDPLSVIKGATESVRLAKIEAAARQVIRRMGGRGSQAWHDSGLTDLAAALTTLDAVSSEGPSDGI